jgi:hypothetical protein
MFDDVPYVLILIIISVADLDPHYLKKPDQDPHQKMKPCMAVDGHMEAWRLKMEPV